MRKPIHHASLKFDSSPHHAICGYGMSEISKSSNGQCKP